MYLTFVCGMTLISVTVAQIENHKVSKLKDSKQQPYDVTD